jgi:hypothetical protein
VGLKLQFTPARHDCGVQPQRAAETFGRGHCLLRGLPVDEEDTRKSEDEIRTLLQSHPSFQETRLLRILEDSVAPTRIRKIGVNIVSAALTPRLHSSTPPLRKA